MKKLKLTPELTKGLQTEARFLALAHALKREVPWILSVRKGGPQDDARGIDFTFHLRSQDEIRVLKVPFQIKSSFSGATNFLKKKERLANILGVPVFVYGQQIGDEYAMLDLKRKLEQQREAETDFSSLYLKKRVSPDTHDFGRSLVGARSKRQKLQMYRDQEAIDTHLELERAHSERP
jgi:hypothetical protein